MFARSDTDDYRLNARRLQSELAKYDAGVAIPTLVSKLHLKHRQSTLQV
jgi:hypothetical protein